MPIRKSYVYKISRSGNYLGVLQNVISEYGYAQDINSAGAQMTITVGLNADNSKDANDAILDEAGNNILDEGNANILSERGGDLVGGTNPNNLIQNNNDVEVWEFSDTDPNGQIVFTGYMSAWEVNFGAEETIKIDLLSYGDELDNYIIEGSQTLDISQTIQTAGFLMSEDNGGGWNRAGQTFTPNLGNVSAITVKLRKAVGGSEIVTLKLWNSIADFFVSPPLGIATFNLVGTTTQDVKFTFPTPVSVNIGQTYFFSVQSTYSSGVSIYYGNDNYSGGVMQASQYGGGSGGGSWGPYYTAYPATNDLYFMTYSTGGATNQTFNGEDPAQILRDIIDSYSSRGGKINYSGPSIVNAGYFVSYTFQVNTVLEGVKKCAQLAPGSYYWYVDPGANILYFKPTPTTPIHNMILGRHIQNLNLRATVEYVANKLYFTGGTVGPSNLYTVFSNVNGLAANANRQRLYRMSDNRVTVTNTANLLASNYLYQHQGEAYNSTVVIPDTVYDISTFQPGDTVGFEGFGTFADNIMLQIVRVNRYSDYVELELGFILKRSSAYIEALQRQLNDAQTIANPSSPS